MRTLSSILLPLALICLLLLWWGNGQGDDNKGSPPSPPSEWSTQNSGTSRILTEISFVDRNIGWAVGWNGSILRYFNQ
jgi:hypothetical protein